MPGDALAVGPGELIGARYRVERELGRSNMSVVFAARDEQLDELVAIKLLLPQSEANSEVRAPPAAKIKGEHMARVTGVAALDDGTPYMVMEYLEGEDLASLLSRARKLPADEAISYVLQICDVLREAHALGLIHRGLEPATIFIAEGTGRASFVKVLDFGISKMERREESPWYSAPEQMKSASSVDARADIWSLGVILCEAVTGKLPFDGATSPEIVVKVLHDAPNLRDVPKPLATVVRRCLSKAAAGRYATVDELVAALTEKPAEILASEPEILDDADDDDEDDSGALVEDEELIPASANRPVQSIAIAAAPPPEAERGSLLPLVAAIGLVAITGLIAARLLAGPAPLPPLPPPEPKLQPAPLAAPLAPEEAPAASVPASAEPTPPPSISARVEVVTADRPEARPAPSASAKEDDGAVALQVAMKNHATLRQACWESSDRTTHVVTVNATIDPAGAVTSASATSADVKLAECVAGQVRTWSFPPAPAARSVQIPVRFRR